VIYRAFHNVLRDYKHLYVLRKSKDYLNGTVHSHRKTEKFFLQLDMFNVCTMDDMAHINAIFKFLPHMHQCGCIDILHCCNDPYLQVSEVTWQWWDKYFA
jgi:hypothetical protein